MGSVLGMCLHGAYSQAGKTDHTNRMMKKVGRCPGWSEGHRATHWGSLVLCLVSRSQTVEEEFHAEGNRIHEVPQAEKHDIFEEAKEVQPGQSVCGMLKGRTREDAWPGHCRLCSRVLILP